MLKYCSISREAASSYFDVFFEQPDINWTEIKQLGRRFEIKA